MNTKTARQKRHVEILDVTRPQAEEFLTKNKVNRPPSQISIDGMARTMNQGEWKLTFEPLAFCDEFIDKDSGEKFGESMIDGQNRVMAFLQSNLETCPFTIWRHCEQDEFEVVGTGRPRSTGDLLAINRRGLKNPALVGSVVQGLLREGCSVRGKLDSWMIRRTLNRVEAEVVQVTTYKRHLKNLANRNTLAAFTLAQLIDGTATEALVNQLRSGQAKYGDPMKPLYEYLYAHVVGPKRDMPNIYLHKVCGAVAAKLAGKQMTAEGFRKPSADGLKWLRESAKEKLNPLIKDLLGKVPTDFYNPSLSFKSQEAIGQAAK